MDDKERKLTKAEAERLSVFQKKIEELEAEGYIKTNLTTSGAKANTLGICYGFLTALPFIIWYAVRGGLNSTPQESGLLWLVIFLAIIFLLIIMHELIHGLTWSFFTKNRFRSISFGVIWKSLNPYCTCNEPLSKSHYIAGLLMPWLLLGIIPCIIAVFIHSRFLMYIGVIMTLSAGGDLLILQMILSHKTNGSALYLDHPTDIGLVCLEKEIQA